MIDRQDVEIASIFHLVESIMVNALFHYRGVKIWNNLSKDSRDIIDTNVFKRRLTDERFVT